jgi:hypothetical protein
MSDAGQSPEAMVQLLKQYRYCVGSELDFHRGLDRVLDLHGIPFVREHNLGGDFGRIDFYLPEHRYGIELKVKGSPSEVLRQLHRYAQCPQIAALIFVTGRPRLAFAPMALNGKPVLTASIWDGQF